MNKFLILRHQDGLIADTDDRPSVPSILKLSMQDRIYLQRRMQQTAITRKVEKMPIPIREVPQRLIKYAIKFHFNIVLVLIILRIIPRIIHHLRHLSIQAMKLRIIRPSWFIGIQKVDDARYISCPAVPPIGIAGVIQ